MVPTKLPSSARRRALRFAGFAAIVSTALVVACCGNVIIDGASGAGAGGAGGSRDPGVGGGTGGEAGCALASTSAAGGPERVTECFAPPGDGCPSQYQAATYITPQPCAYLVLVDCGPVVEGGQCCYLATEQPHPCGP